MLWLGLATKTTQLGPGDHAWSCFGLKYQFCLQEDAGDCPEV